MNIEQQQWKGFFPIAREKPDIGFEEFFRKYYLTEQPVIIEGIGQDWIARERWNSDYLFHALSREPTAKSTELWYWLERDGLDHDYRTPDIINRLYDSDVIFPRSQSIRIWIHNRGHVSNWHYDTNLVNVFNAQITGKKEWLLLSPDNPPVCYPFSNFAIVGEDDEKVCAGSVHTRFTLNEGDMVYLPPLWFHKVTSHDEENININWIFTNKSTNIMSKTLERDLERYLIQIYFFRHRYHFVRNLARKFHQALPSYLRYSWRYETLIESPYIDTWYKRTGRVFKELMALGKMLMYAHRIYPTMNSYGSVRQLEKS